MAAKPSNVKFMGRAGGVVHVVTTKREDLKNSNCSVVKKNHDEGLWGRKGMSPEAALALKGCVRCSTHEVAESERKAQMTPAQRRAERKRVAQETMEKLKPGGNRPKKSPKGKDHNKSEKRSGRDGGGMKRRGPKGGDATAKMKASVEEHAKIAKDNGWKIKTAGETGTNEWTCEAVCNGETLKLIYRDGRTVWSRVVLKSGVEVRLRNSSNWRKHATGEGAVRPDYAPRKQQGKKAARKELVVEESPRNLPFNLETDDHDTIIESLLGKRITWRMTITPGSQDSAVVPTRARNVRIVIHPKSERAMISFHESQGMGDHGEMLAGERTVYLDKIIRVEA